MSLSESIAPKPQSSQKPAKVGHRKSRLGCQRCKQRRVKCDEQKPICGNCSRHGAECVYIEVRPKQNTPDAGDSENSQTSRTRRRRSKLLSAVAYRGPPPVGDMFPDSYANSDDPEIPETKARRMLELRLLQNNLINLSQPNPTRANAEWLKLWQVVMPTLALHHENVLYAMFSLSATHILRKERSNNALYNARQNYLVLALREQRQEVADINEDNVDAVCLTSILIVISSFAMLQERSLQPYHPPLEWLQLGRGAGAVMWKANAAVPGNIGARFQILIDPRPTATDEEVQMSNLPSHFRAVLDTFREREVFDDEIEEAYKKALCYIGSIQEAIDRGEPSYVVGRQIQAFPLVVPTKFTDLISEHRPRALVVLAYFFGTVAQIGSDLWWCSGVEGDHDRTAYREIQALFDFVTPEWKTLMTWPLDCLQRLAR